MKTLLFWHPEMAGFPNEILDYGSQWRIASISFPLNFFKKVWLRKSAIFVVIAH